MLLRKTYLKKEYLRTKGSFNDSKMGLNSMDPETDEQGIIRLP